MYVFRAVTVSSLESTPCPSYSLRQLHCHVLHAAEKVTPKSTGKKRARKAKASPEKEDEQQEVADEDGLEGVCARACVSN